MTTRESNAHDWLLLEQKDDNNQERYHHKNDDDDDSNNNNRTSDLSCHLNPPRAPPDESLLEEKEHAKVITTTTTPRTPDSIGTPSTAVRSSTTATITITTTPPSRSLTRRRRRRRRLRQRPRQEDEDPVSLDQSLHLVVEHDHGSNNGDRDQQDNPHNNNIKNNNINKSPCFLDEVDVSIIMESHNTPDNHINMSRHDNEDPNSSSSSSSSSLLSHGQIRTLFPEEDDDDEPEFAAAKEESSLVKDSSFTSDWWNQDDDDEEEGPHKHYHKKHGPDTTLGISTLSTPPRYLPECSETLLLEEEEDDDDDDDDDDKNNSNKHNNSLIGNEEEHHPPDPSCLSNQHPTRPTLTKRLGIPPKAASPIPTTTTATTTAYPPTLLLEGPHQHHHHHHSSPLWKDSSSCLMMTTTMSSWETQSSSSWSSSAASSPPPSSSRLNKNRTRFPTKLDYHKKATRLRNQPPPLSSSSLHYPSLEERRRRRNQQHQQHPSPPLVVSKSQRRRPIPHSHRRYYHQLRRKHPHQYHSPHYWHSPQQPSSSPSSHHHHTPQRGTGGGPLVLDPSRMLLANNNNIKPPMCLRSSYPGAIPSECFLPRWWGSWSPLGGGGKWRTSTLRLLLWMWTWLAFCSIVALILYQSMYYYYWLEDPNLFLLAHATTNTTTRTKTTMSSTAPVSTSHPNTLGVISQLPSNSHYSGDSLTSSTWQWESKNDASSLSSSSFMSRPNPVRLVQLATLMDQQTNRNDDDGDDYRQLPGGDGVSSANKRSPDLSKQQQQDYRRHNMDSFLEPRGRIATPPDLSLPQPPLPSFGPLVPIVLPRINHMLQRHVHESVKALHAFTLYHHDPSRRQRRQQRQRHNKSTNTTNRKGDNDDSLNDQNNYHDYDYEAQRRAVSLDGRPLDAFLRHENRRHNHLDDSGDYRHRTLQLYPATYTDPTQLYGVLDSSDARIRNHMEPRAPLKDDECIPMKKWQTTFYPSCNDVHALGLERLGDPTTPAHFFLFGTKGYWRNAWKVDVLSVVTSLQSDNATTLVPTPSSAGATAATTTTATLVTNDTVVLKTLKIKHTFEEAHYEHNRVDAVAMERLTASNHVINIFGYCGQSVLTEYANGKRLGSLADKAKKTPLARLRIARDIAQGLADVHGMGAAVDDDEEEEEKEENEYHMDKTSQVELNPKDDKTFQNVSTITTNTTTQPTTNPKPNNGGFATFVHLDINPANVIDVGGRLKLNDFNIGILRRWNISSSGTSGSDFNETANATRKSQSQQEQQQPCGFPAQFSNPQWRSPEEARNEQDLTEKVDVYSMGHIFFRLICGHEPWNKLEPGGKPNHATITRAVQEGRLPNIPNHILESTNPEVVAIRQAMLACYTLDPKSRPSAQEIVVQLERDLTHLEQQKQEQQDVVIKKHYGPTRMRHSGTVTMG